MLNKGVILCIICFLFLTVVLNTRASALCIDSDGDGYGNPASIDCTYDKLDCDDTDALVYPGAPKICDGKDNNCDGIRDFSTDVDNDGDGAMKCTTPAGIRDCDDNDPLESPFLTEGPPGDPTCSDLRDNDCDGKINLADPGCQNPCLDNDGDGYYAVSSPAACTLPKNDCNDNNAAIHPGASETACNGVDNDCDLAIDEDYTATGTNCGVGDCAATGLNECQSGVIVNTCVPGTPGVEGPFGEPTCDAGSGDEDCDGLANAADPDCTPCVPTGLTDDNCDGVDDDCIGGPDQLYVATVTNCGIGACATAGLNECQSGVIVNTCVPLPAGVEGPPGNATCSDSSDNDCDGLVDLNDPSCGAPCPDGDGDGYVVCDGVCDVVPGKLCGECDDTDALVYPGAPKICDGKDNNCDGIRDFSTDVDSDGDGAPKCTTPSGIKDCDDSDPLESPFLTEGPPGDTTCSDLRDNDCDGKVDILDSLCIPPSCDTKVSPRNGPHMFDLLDPSTGLVLKQPCRWCHYNTIETLDQRLECQRCHADPADTSDPLNGVLKAAYPLDPPYGFATAPNVNTHLYDAVGPVTAPHCLTCHNPHLQEQDERYGTSYGMLIKEFICYDETALGNHFEELVEFTAPEGPGSFADGPPHNENICEMCHTQTLYHRNDGSTVVHNDGANCTDCHAHGQGFKASCGSCHEAPPPTGSHLKHFGGDPDFAAYGSTGITKDYVSQSAEYIMNCGNCHPIDSASHQNGVLNPGGGRAEIELYNPAAPAGSLKAMNPATATYTPGATILTDASGFTYTEGSCDNVYCHSVTQTATVGPVPDPAPFVYPLEYSPPWQSLVERSTAYMPTLPWGTDTDPDGMCNNCHGNPITTDTSTVSAGAGDTHQWIDDFGYGNLHAFNMGYDPLQCNTCHYSTVHAVSTWTRDVADVTTFGDVAIFNAATHVNGVKDVEFTPAPIVYPTSKGDVTYDLGTASFNPDTKRCDNVGCHQDQTSVEWGNPYRWWNSTECNVCHSF